MRAILLLLFVVLPTAVQAATLNVCVRNDGVGTFSGFDFNVIADCTPNAGDRSEPGPGQWQDLDPGERICVQFTGLSEWNGYQYEYDFNITFQDTSGLTSEPGPQNIRLPSGTRYLGANGLSTFAPSLSSYISIATTRRRRTRASTPTRTTRTQTTSVMSTGLG
jgi:hypothetical protein